MSGRRKVARAATVAAGALAVGLPVAGCGDDSAGPTASIESVPTAPKTTAGRPAPQGKRSTPRDPRAAAPGRRRSGARGSTNQLFARALTRLPRSKRAGVTRGMARATLLRFGFADPRVTVTSSGSTVAATIGKRDACTATRETSSRLAETLRQQIPWLRSVEIVVSPSGSPLSEYVRRHCKPAALPRGNGRVVLTATGASLKTTRSFTVRSRRWSVEYFNGGRHLIGFVLKGAGQSGDSFRTTKRGPGRHVFTGAGTFKLQIAGVGEWTVRVRDGV